jgi:hypothetical protein
MSQLVGRTCRAMSQEYRVALSANRFVKSRSDSHCTARHTMEKMTRCTRSCSTPIYWYEWCRSAGAAASVSSRLAEDVLHFWVACQFLGGVNVPRSLNSTIVMLSRIDFLGTDSGVPAVWHIRPTSPLAAAQPRLNGPTNARTRQLCILEQFVQPAALMRGKTLAQRA